MADVFSEMADSWPSGVVARGDIGRFTGGLIAPAYAANLDSEGRGCPGRMRLGRKIVYPKAALVSWLRTRQRPVESGARPSRRHRG
jgi:hypothetical protein